MNDVDSSSTPQWRSMDLPTLQREYSPSSAIGGNYAPYIDDYIALSKQAYANCDRVETVVYGDKPSNTIDIALPEPNPANACPLVVFFHGGYWQALSKRESFFGADKFCANGIGYAAIDYTLAPAASLAQIVEESELALETLFARASDLGIDPNRIVLAGSSAGAHLSAMCCAAEKFANATHRFGGVILLSGIFELEPFVAISDNEAVGLSVKQAQQHSPLLHNVDLFPDAVIAWGEHETLEFKRQSIAMGAKLSDATRSVQTFECAGRNHFDIVHDMADPTTRLGQHTLELTSKGG